METRIYKMTLTKNGEMHIEMTGNMMDCKWAARGLGMTWWRIEGGINETHRGVDRMQAALRTYEGTIKRIA